MPPFVWLRLRHNLRAQLAFGVALPLLVALGVFSVVHYWRERQMADEQARQAAVQLGQTLTSGLRHTMLMNDRQMLANVITDVSAVNDILRAQIVDLNLHVKLDSAQIDVGLTRQLTETGCQECHRYPPAQRPRTTMLSGAANVLRVATPISNAPECADCHDSEHKHLGILLVDMELGETRQHILQDLHIDLALSLGVTFAVTLGVYALVHWVGVRRVEAFREPLARYTAGDFSLRLPAPSGPTDELGELAQAFNQMADKLEAHRRAEEALQAARQRAVVEERERIGRELHDGLAQLLGYVGAKATAVRLLLQQGQQPAAEKQLQQLEQAARELFTDVREAILGLKLSGLAGSGLGAALIQYVDTFRQLSGLPVEVSIAPTLAAVQLDAETEWQLFRIVQEALTNVRKHAAANRAWVHLHNGGQQLRLIVGDDGHGFSADPLSGGATHHRPHFGLSSMRERAEAIGAHIRIESQPGGGTQVALLLNWESAAKPGDRPKTV